MASPSVPKSSLTTAPKLHKRASPHFKSRIANRLVPCSRAALRALPFWQRTIWKNVIQGRLEWRSYQFVKAARFGAYFGGNIEDLIPRYIYFFGCWEPHVDALISRCLKPGDTFIDVGANIGYFSLLAAKLVGPLGQVFAFEACAETYRQLADNIQRNGLGGLVRSTHVAVADREGLLTLHCGPAGNRGMASLVRDSGKGTEQVQGKPLGMLLTEEQLSATRLIKIDVEGAEQMVLNGVEPVLGRLNHSDILLEINPALSCWARIISQLQAAGWEPYEIVPGDSLENYFCFPVEPGLIPLRGAADRRVDVFLARKERPLPC